MARTGYVLGQGPVLVLFSSQLSCLKECFSTPLRRLLSLPARVVVILLLLLQDFGVLKKKKRCPSLNGQTDHLSLDVCCISLSGFRLSHLYSHCGFPSWEISRFFFISAKIFLSTCPYYIFLRSLWQIDVQNLNIAFEIV